MYFETEYVTVEVVVGGWLLLTDKRTGEEQYTDWGDLPDNTKDLVKECNEKCGEVLSRIFSMLSSVLEAG